MCVPYKGGLTRFKIVDLLFSGLLPLSSSSRAFLVYLALEIIAKNATRSFAS